MPRAPRPGFSLTNTMTAPPAVGPWPGTTTQTNLDWEKQQQDQMAQALQGMGTLVSQAEAAQFARQQEAQQAQQQYMAAANAAPNLAPPLGMALPYAAAQFSSALSGRPEVGQQANESLALNRATQLQRRSQILDQLATQNQQAAERAQSAGDLTNALKFNTKANLLLKQLEESGTALRESHQVAQRQTFEAWQTQYNARAEYLSRLVSAGASDPVLAARLFALKEAHDSNVKTVQDELNNLKFDVSPKGLQKKGELQAKAEEITNEYTRQVETALAGRSIGAPLPPAVVPPPPAPVKPKGPGLKAQAMGVVHLFNPRREMRDAVDLIHEKFQGQSRAEIVAALLEKEPQSGRSYADIIGSRYGLSGAALLAAARRSAGGGGKF